MRFRGLLVAVVLLAALGVGLYFSNKEKAAEAAKPPADAPPKILALTEGDITKVALKKKGADETVLRESQRQMADHRAQAIPGRSGCRQPVGGIGGQCQRRSRGRR